MSKGSGNPFSSNLMRDASYTPYQAGNSFQTQDDTASAKTSPLAYSSVEIALTVPDRAVELVMSASTALRVSEITGMTRYYVLPASTVQAFGVAATQTVYIKRDASDGTLSFYFVII